MSSLDVDWSRPRCVAHRRVDGQIEVTAVARAGRLLAVLENEMRGPPAARTTGCKSPACRLARPVGLHVAPLGHPPPDLGEHVAGRRIVHSRKVPPDQSVSSFSCSRSRRHRRTPSRRAAVPIGNASTHCCAGRRYQSVRLLANIWSVAAAPVRCCCPRRRGLRHRRRPRWRPDRRRALRSESRNRGARRRCCCRSWCVADGETMLAAGGPCPSRRARRARFGCPRSGAGARRRSGSPPSWRRSARRRSGRRMRRRRCRRAAASRPAATRPRATASWSLSRSGAFHPRSAYRSSSDTVRARRSSATLRS